jgi:hypothetical protein
MPEVVGKLEVSDYKNALFSQGACNLSGIAHELSRVISKVWNEAHEQGHGTEWVNAHPIVRLYAEQIMHLASKREWSEAYKICEKEVEREGVDHGEGF